VESRCGGLRTASTVAIFVLAFHATQIYAAVAPSFDPSSCHLSGVTTPDNDIRLYGDDRLPGRPVAIPPEVIDKFRAVARRIYAQAPPKSKEGAHCENVFPGIYRIALAHKRVLFVAKIYVRYFQYFVLIVYDPVTGAMTPNPVQIRAYWTENFGAKDELMKTPFVSSADLYQNRQPQIVFESRAHNGSMYNAVVYQYFAIAPDLSLKLVLARETRLADDSGNLIIRELTPLSPSRLRLDIYRVADAGTPQGAKLGYVILASGGADEPFRVVRRHAPNSGNFVCLVTCMDEAPSDDTFLHEGDPNDY